MKAILQLVFPTFKAIVAVMAFFVGLGWSSFVAVNLIVKAEGQDVRKELYSVRTIDKGHYDEKFSEMHKRFDKLEELIIGRSK